LLTGGIFGATSARPLNGALPITELAYGAIDSHARVDQAIGVLLAVHRLAPAAGFDVLREVSQHTNIKLHTVAEAVIEWAMREKPLPPPVDQELQEALQRHSQTATSQNQHD
jgi:hypothetical protein